MLSIGEEEPEEVYGHECDRQQNNVDKLSIQTGTADPKPTSFGCVQTNVEITTAVVIG